MLQNFLQVIHDCHHPSTYAPFCPSSSSTSPQRPADGTIPLSSPRGASYRCHPECTFRNVSAINVLRRMLHAPNNTPPRRCKQEEKDRTPRMLTKMWQEQEHLSSLKPLLLCLLSLLFSWWLLLFLPVY